MGTHFPAVLVVATMLVLLPQAYAANCTGRNPDDQCGSQNLASRMEQFAARQRYCGNNLWKAISCYVDGKVKITMSNPGATNREICWDALENIVDQCGTNYMRGTYESNGAQYKLYRCVSYDGGCRNNLESV